MIGARDISPMTISSSFRIYLTLIANSSSPWDSIQVGSFAAEEGDSARGVQK